MPLLMLPAEIVDLAIANLSFDDLWSLYDSCHVLRIASAWHLFRSVKIRLNGSVPESLNNRCFYHFETKLRQWSHLVQRIDLWADEDLIDPGFIKALSGFDNLRSFCISYPPNERGLRKILLQLAEMSNLKSLSVDFMSPRAWEVPVEFHYLQKLHLSCIEHEPGICDIPKLPVLKRLTLEFFCYCLVCPKNDQGPCILLQFSQLPQLESLMIKGGHEKNIILSGRANRVQSLHLSSCSGSSFLRSTLMSLGANLQDIMIKECEFDRESFGIVESSACLRQVQIERSSSALLPFSTFHLPGSVQLDLQIQPEDFEALEDWHHILEFLRQRSIFLYLDCTEDQWNHFDHMERLWQVISLENVTLRRPLSAQRAEMK